MPNSSRRTTARSVGTGVGVALVAIVCCAGPALIAGGGLAFAGGLLRSPVVVGLGLVVIAASAVVVQRRREDRAFEGSTSGVDIRFGPAQVAPGGAGSLNGDRADTADLTGRD